MRPLTFCEKFNAYKHYFEGIFDIKRIFGSIQPESKSIILFQYSIIFEVYQSFGPLALLPREIVMCADDPVRNLMLNNFYLEHFLI